LTSDDLERGRQSFEANKFHAYGTFRLLGRLMGDISSYLPTLKSKISVPNSRVNQGLAECLLLEEGKVKQSNYKPEVPRGFQEVKVPRLRDNRPAWW